MSCIVRLNCRTLPNPAAKAMSVKLRSVSSRRRRAKCARRERATWSGVAPICSANSRRRWRALTPMRAASSFSVRWSRKPSMISRTARHTSSGPSTQASRSDVRYGRHWKQARSPAASAAAADLNGVTFLAQRAAAAARSAVDARRADPGVAGCAHDPMLPPPACRYWPDSDTRAHPAWPGGQEPDVAADENIVGQGPLDPDERWLAVIAEATADADRRPRRGRGAALRQPGRRGALRLPAGRPPGSRLLDLVHPDDLDLVVASLVEMADIEVPGAPLEVRVRAADGRWLHVEVVTTNLLDDERFGGMILSIRDITDRRAAERARASAERVLDHTFAHNPIGMVLCTLDGRFVKVNPGLLRARWA